MRVAGLSGVARRSPIVVAAAAIALAVVFALPPTPGPVSHAPTPPSSGFHLAPTQRPVPSFSAPVRGAARPLSIVGPLNGRYFNASTVNPEAAAGFSFGIAVDPSSQVVYESLYEAGAVTAFSESTGALLNYAPVSDAYAGWYPFGLAFDPVHHDLFVAIVGPAHGSVLVLNATTLAVVANITDAAYPANSFEPFMEVYDAASGNVYVTNESGGEVVAVGTAGLSILANIPCPVVGCQDGGIAAVPRHHEIAAATGTGSVVLYNSSTNTIDATLTIPGSGPFYSVGAAYDGVKDRLYFGNSSGTPTVFFAFNATSRASTGSLSGDPQYLATLTSDSADHQLIATNTTSATIVAVDESTGSQTAVFSKPSPFPQFFASTAIDPTTHRVVASGYYNNSSYAFSLPTLVAEVQYASIPLEQVGVQVDPALGEYIVGSIYSSELAAYSEATGARLWTRYTPLVIGLERFAVDPVQGEIYFPTPDGRLVVLNASTGAFITRLTLTATANATVLTVDPSAHLLYVGENNQHVQVFSTTLHNALGNIATPGLIPCAGVADTGSTHVAFFANCGTPGNVTEVSGLTYTRGTVYAAGNGTSWLADDGNGFVYALNPPTHNITKISVQLGAKVGAIGLGTLAGIAIAADGTDNLLEVTSIVNQSYDVLSTISDSVVYAHPSGTPLLTNAYDPSAGTFVALEALTGRVDLLSRVATPAAPAGLVLTPGNDTIAATWGVPASGGGPISGYTASIGTSASGPWTNQSVTSPSATFSGLADGTKYFVEVAASNVAGAGPASTPSNATPSGIPYPPTAVALTSVNSTVLGLSWSAPASTDGSALLNYTVYWKATTASSWNQVSVGTALAETLTGLQPSTNYSAYVIAWNGKGASNPSASVVLETAAAPSPHKSSSTGLFGGSSWLLYVLLAVVAVAVVASIVLLVRRRRPPAGTAPPTAPSGATLGPPTPPPGGSPPTPWSEEPPTGPTPPVPPQ